MSKIVILGGGGYVGSVLTRKLAALGHTVTVFDTFWYGVHLPPKVAKIRGDIRDKVLVDSIIHGADTVIHLACISNDPSSEINPALTKDVNYTSFRHVLRSVRAGGVQQFIFASSSSVYGVQDGNVTEKNECFPITDYSRFKLWCENDLQEANLGETRWTIVRPATVCGYSPRQRFDLIVNALTISALETKRVKIFGGPQKRPNIHISDMCRAYYSIMQAPSGKTHGETFNVGGPNYTVDELGCMVAGLTGAEVDRFGNVQDPRSYHIDSDKIYRAIGFKPLRSLSYAVEELQEAHAEVKFPDALNNSQYYNVSRMKELNL